MTMFSEVKQALEDIKQMNEEDRAQLKAEVTTLKAEQAEQKDRIETLESYRGRPGKTAPGGVGPATRHKAYYTESGTVFEIPHDVLLADVLPQKKLPEISLERWIAAALLGDRCRDKLAVEHAKESKQLVTTTTGVLIPAEYQAQWWDLIRPQAVLNAAGMRTVVMDAKTQVHSAVVADPAVTWHQEAGSISADNPTFEARSLVAKTAVVRCQSSLELSQDCPDFGARLTAVMARSMAAAIDKAGLVGSGTYGPQGLWGASGVGTIPIVGTPADYTDILAGVEDLLEANVLLEAATANAIMSPRTWATFAGLPTGITSDKSPLPRPPALANMIFRPTTAVPNTTGGSPANAESLIFLGDFTQLVLGVRQESAVEALKLTTFASNLLLEFVGYTRLDFMVARPSSFVVLEGVTNT